MPLRSVRTLKPGEKKGGWIAAFVPAKPPARDSDTPGPSGVDTTTPGVPSQDRPLNNEP
jgi:hypothetical protein